MQSEEDSSDDIENNIQSMSSLPTTEFIPRRSQRLRGPPMKFADYYVNRVTRSNVVRLIGNNNLSRSDNDQKWRAFRRYGRRGCDNNDICFPP